MLIVPFEVGRLYSIRQDMHVRIDWFMGQTWLFGLKSSSVCDISRDSMFICVKKTTPRELGILNQFYDDDEIVTLLCNGMTYYTATSTRHSSGDAFVLND